MSAPEHLLPLCPTAISDFKMNIFLLFLKTWLISFGHHGLVLKCPQGTDTVWPDDNIVNLRLFQGFVDSLREYDQRFME